MAIEFREPTTAEYERIFVGLTTAERIEWLRARGSSLVMRWADEVGLWEVDWVSGGVLYAGIDPNLHFALHRAWRLAEQARVRR